MRSRVSQIYIRNIVFGVEDSLVSTVGFLSGIAAANVARETLFLSGLILIVVEALSMGVGSLLSEASVEELKTANIDNSRASTGGLVMFGSYFISGFIPLAPYFLFSRPAALPVSIACSLLALFILGFISAKFGKARPWKSALRMALLGGLAITAGVLVGKFIQI